MDPETAQALERGEGPKGDVLATARLAGFQAAKRTSELIPLAHPLPLAFAGVEATVDPERGTVEIEAEARVIGRTGVEMEAMTAAAVAALTVYDMVRHSSAAFGSKPSSWSRRAAAAAVTGAARAQAARTASGARGGADGLDPRAPSGEGEDVSGEKLAELARRLGADEVEREVLPDERELIESRLRHWTDDVGCDLVLTTGGTGLAPTDVTPEATAAMIDRPAPGIAEAIRQASQPHTDLWMLSRGVAGTRGSTLIVNFPGSPASIEQTAAALEQALPHALALLRGDSAGH